LDSDAINGSKVIGGRETENAARSAVTETPKQFAITRRWTGSLWVQEIKRDGSRFICPSAPFRPHCSGEDRGSRASSLIPLLNPAPHRLETQCARPALCGFCLATTTLAITAAEIHVRPALLVATDGISGAVLPWEAGRGHSCNAESNYTNRRNFGLATYFVQGRSPMPARRFCLAKPGVHLFRGQGVVLRVPCSPPDEGPNANNANAGGICSQHFGSVQSEWS